jgi:hypothetical protein
LSLLQFFPQAQGVLELIPYAPKLPKKAKNRASTSHHEKLHVQEQTLLS